MSCLWTHSTLCYTFAIICVRVMLHAFRLCSAAVQPPFDNLTLVPSLLLNAALQSNHLELAAKLLQLHGSSLSSHVLLNSLPRILALEAWQLAETVTALMEQPTGTKQQVKLGCR
jgi:hypothetical protein